MIRQLCNSKMSITVPLLQLIAACTVDSQDPDLLREPSRAVVDNALTSADVLAATIIIAPQFRYVGGQRFVLRGHTDVEQHFFVVADNDGDVEQMYWIQFEKKLPNNEGRFEYPSSDQLRIGDVELIPHVRRYDSEPVDDSDRGAAYRFLANEGYQVPTPALRARLIHIPEGMGRDELMIVYLENTSDVGDVLTQERDAMLRRAINGLSINQPYKQR